MDFGDIEKSAYGGNLEEDEELLAELAAIQAEEMGKAKRRAAPPQPAAKKGHGEVPGVDSRALAAAMADHHGEANDEQLEMDEELLNELAGLVGGAAPETSSRPPATLPPPIPARNPVATTAAPAPPQGRDEAQISHLRQLHAVYSKLMKAAEQGGEGAKARRYKRAVETLVQLVKAAERGEKIDASKIPVAPPNFVPDPHPTAPVAQAVHHPPQPSIRHAASTEGEGPPDVPPPVPQRKRSDAPPAVPERKLSHSLEPADPKKAEILRVLKRRRDLYVKNGKEAIAAHDKEAAKEYVTMAKSFDQAIAALDQVSADELDMNDVPPSPKPYRKRSEPAAPTPAPAPPAPKPAGPGGFIGALMERHQRYLKMAEKAKTEGNERKARMNTRIAGQYADAIKAAKAGGVVDVAELPKLPDMGELPPQTAAPRPTQQHVHQRVQPEVGPLAPSGVPGKSRNSAQLDFLLQRQGEFKQAAMRAKTLGDIETAKKFLLEAKGFDKMIEAARAGLPVSIKQTPIPPQLQTSNAALQPRIQASTSGGALEGRDEKLAFLEKTLIEQVRTAESNQMRFTRLGDVGKVKLFENWAKSSRQDLLLVRAVAQQNLNLPKFHTEAREIPSADLFPDLAEDVMELTITKCRDVPLPSGYEPHHANIYLKWTFPFPTESPQNGKTKTIGGTISPEFGEVVMLQIGAGKSRNSKLQRAFKRGGLKFEVYQKGGFMRSDKLLGTCEWKLEKLEHSAEMEESLPLKEGRKAVGGLASARVRIREPIGDAKSQCVSQKWLILDN